MASAMFAGPGYLTVAYLSLPYASASSSFSNNVLSYLSRMIVCIISLVPELIGWAISRYSPSAAFRLGIAMNSPFSPSITLISWITNSLSKVMETIAFIFPSFSTLLTLTSVTCMFQYSFRFFRQPPCCTPSAGIRRTGRTML